MNTFPLQKGLCISCFRENKCPIPERISRYWEKMFSDYLAETNGELKPDLWNENCVEEPIVKDESVIQCPLFSDKNNIMVKKAAYIRNDGALATGKSHADIIQNSPKGTCKAGSKSGFIDNYGVFLTREEAYIIALKAGQLVTEKIVKNGEYLLSEEIWSDRENGQWTYDEEKGYVKK